jgi:DNA-binding response OmpR family regulator
MENLPAPTLVLLDVMLPYLDGFELITKIREHATWKEVPIIMLTAKSQEQNIVRALDQGANDYVVKPFRPGELMSRIRRVMKS